MSYKEMIFDEIRQDLYETGIPLTVVENLIESADEIFNEAAGEYAVLNEEYGSSLKWKVFPWDKGGVPKESSVRYGQIANQTSKYSKKAAQTGLANIPGQYEAKKKASLLSKIKSSFKKLPKGAKVALIAGALSLAAFVLYKALVNRYSACARACRNAPDKTACIAKCKINYYTGAIAVLKKAEADLKKEGKLTDAKKRSIEKKISNLKAKIEKEKAKLK